MTAYDYADLSRERRDDDLAGDGDDFRARALDRADRLREVSDLPEMGAPFISVERVRPAQREYEPRPRVRSHEVRRFGKTSPMEWVFLIVCGLTLVAGLLFFAALFFAVAMP